jgi:hypothetical protein
MKTAFLFVAVLALLCSVKAQTLCEKYQGGGTQEDLVTTIVTLVVGEVVADPITLPFFDGSAAAGLTNFTAGGAPLDNLVASLVAYFGSSAILGCNEVGFPQYAGGPMQAVHAKLPISYQVFTTFNALVVEVADDLGVEDADLLAIAGVLAKGDTLEDDGTFYTEICNEEDCANFCNFYSNALVLTNFDLLTTVVVETFGAITVADSPILKYFDGSETNDQDGTGDFVKTDFTAAGGKQDGLVDGLRSFFGDGLGCTDGTIQPYSGEKDMAKVHAPMNSEEDGTLITQEEFDFFNDELIGVLIAAGVSGDDADGVRAVLDSFQDDICGGCAGDGGSSASLLIPALFAIIPVLAFFF